MEIWDESLPLGLQKYEMKPLHASLQDRPPYNKFLILVGITLISAVLFTAMAVGLCQAIWGVNLGGQN